jgi:hypothetical protein
MAARLRPHLAPPALSDCARHGVGLLEGEGGVIYPASTECLPCVTPCAFLSVLCLQARLEPIDLASFEPPTGRRFALRQLELMQHKGLGKRSAAVQVGADGRLGCRRPGRQ